MNAAVNESPARRRTCQLVQAVLCIARVIRHVSWMAVGSLATRLADNTLRRLPSLQGRGPYRDWRRS